MIPKITDYNADYKLMCSSVSGKYARRIAQRKYILIKQDLYVTRSGKRHMELRSEP